MTLPSLVIFFAILFVLVTIHEFGHFIFAKFFKMRVDEFAFGFPPSLFSKKVGETKYSFNLIPLGGYVKIFGENGLTEEERKNLTPHEVKQLFGSKSILARLLVLSGGVIFNILGAVVLFALAFSYGTKVAISEEDLLNFSGEKQVLLTGMDPKSSLVGTMAELGDEVVAISANGNELSLLKDKNIFNRVSIREFIQNNENSELTLTFKNGENLKTVVAYARPGIIEGKKILGVEFTDLGFKKENFFQAIPEATFTTYEQIKLILVSLYDLVKNLIFGEAKVSENLSGPIGLAMLTSKVSERGLDQIYTFAAMISLSLAVFNFLPIPALDGGRIVFVLIEAITRRKVKVEVEQIIHSLGFLLLLLLMVFVSYYDLVKAVGF
jgi:regulator of sigma E protease